MPRETSKGDIAHTPGDQSTNPTTESYINRRAHHFKQLYIILYMLPHLIEPRVALPIHEPTVYMCEPPMKMPHATKRHSVHNQDP